LPALSLFDQMSLPKTELERQLLSRIMRDGPIPFRDFMQAALYDPDMGYYNTARAKIGPEGDYYTSSNVHPAFGAVLARALVELWQSSPAGKEPLTILEAGAGTGRLAFDILSALRDEHGHIFERLNYLIDEVSPAMRARQKDQLAAFSGRVGWQGNGFDQYRGDAILFSNELIDAMPVHRVRMHRGRIEEGYVAARQDANGEARLSMIWDKVSSERIIQYIERLGASLLEGQIVEVNLDALDYLKRAANAINEGYAVTIDYGDLAAHLWSADRAEGTLRSFYRHRLSGSPLERPGEQDITASVNFTALIEYGRDFGLEKVSYERQSSFLIRMGLIDRVGEIYAGSDAVDDLRERLLIKNLFVPGGVSDNFRVLIQKKRASGA
jgi:SAM-dependent MidA family methyltransferase